LAAYQQPTDRRPAGMLRWWRRGSDQPARTPGGLTLATQQANRAHDRERELRQHQQRRDGWLEANAHLGPAYRQVVRTLAWQRRATGLAVEADRPGYVLEALGLEPRDPIQREARQRARTAIGRVHGKQRAADRTRDLQSTSQPNSTPRTRDQAAPPDRRDPERAAG
jgi:hypothetical protein